MIRGRWVEVGHRTCEIKRRCVPGWRSFCHSMRYGMSCVGHFLSMASWHLEVFMAHYVYVSQKVDSGYVPDPAIGATVWFLVFTCFHKDTGGILLMRWDDARLLRGTYTPEGCGRSQVDFSNLRRLPLHLWCWMLHIMPHTKLKRNRMSPSPI